MQISSEDMDTDMESRSESSDECYETGSDLSTDDFGSQLSGEESSERDHESVESDSDLELLYESFEYEDGASQASATEDREKEVVAPQYGIAASVCGKLDTPLYQNAPLTILQSYMLLFQCAIRHCLTSKALTELLQLLSVHIPLGAALPKSVHSLKQFFVRAYPHTQPVEHFYCSFCQRPLPSCDTKCSGRSCTGGSSGVFITIPLGPQLKLIMKGTVLQQQLKRRSCKNCDSL